jgi:methylthioribose-1-phosphate isomerase
MIPTLEWLPEGVNFLDQTKLPLEETYVLATDYKQVATVIRDMIVRGAPAIGVAAAMGMALGIERSMATTLDELTAEVAVIAKTLAETRPTAVNLFWGIDEIRGLFNSLAATNTPIAEIKSAVIARARQMYDEDIAACKQMGAHGAALLPMEGTVLTHCNAGALATCGYGTALGVIRAAIERGQKISVFADLRQHGRRADAPGTHSGCDCRFGQDCGQWRCGQQDRDLRRRNPGPRARDSVLRRCSVVDG